MICRVRRSPGDKPTIFTVDGETKITTSGGVFSYTDEQVKENVDEYKGKASSLQMVQTTVPLVGLVLGLAETDRHRREVHVR